MRRFASLRGNIRLPIRNAANLPQRFVLNNRGVTQSFFYLASHHCALSPSPVLFPARLGYAGEDIPLLHRGRYKLSLLLGLASFL